jgi:hypothetical protein
MDSVKKIIVRLSGDKKKDFNVLVARRDRAPS